MRNPIEFENKDVIQSVYSGKIYTVLDNGRKSGMAFLAINGRIEKWNSCNNAHFTKVEIGTQLNLFSHDPTPRTRTQRLP